MYEKELIARLAGDSELVSLLGTYNNKPCIFDQEKPKTPPFPYLVIRIEKYGVDAAVSKFTTVIDYFGHTSERSRLQARQAVERIEYLLKYYSLASERYSDVRHYECDIIPVPNEDPRAVQYSVRFDARAVESKWIKQI